MARGCVGWKCSGGSIDSFGIGRAEGRDGRRFLNKSSVAIVMIAISEGAGSQSETHEYMGKHEVLHLQR